jgi:hypothetical protein
VQLRADLYDPHAGGNGAGGDGDWRPPEDRPECRADDAWKQELGFLLHLYGSDHRLARAMKLHPRQVKAWRKRENKPFPAMRQKIHDMYERHAEQAREGEQVLIAVIQALNVIERMDSHATIDDAREMARKMRRRLDPHIGRLQALAQDLNPDS